MSNLNFNLMLTLITTTLACMYEILHVFISVFGEGNMKLKHIIIFRVGLLCTPNSYFCNSNSSLLQKNEFHLQKGEFNTQKGKLHLQIREFGVQSL